MRFSLHFATGMCVLMLAACSASVLPTQPTYDFEQAGTLVRNNPGLSPGVWYLEYEQPGSPALTMRLSFAEDAQCIQGAQRSTCERSIFEQGLTVTIRGNRQADGVLVEEMELQ